MHSDGDRLFPVKMARRIAAACGKRGQLVVVSGLRHNEPYIRPTQLYWCAVLQWIDSLAGDEQAVDNTQGGWVHGEGDSKNGEEARS